MIRYLLGIDVFLVMDNLRYESNFIWSCIDYDIIDEGEFLCWENWEIECYNIFFFFLDKWIDDNREIIVCLYLLILYRSFLYLYMGKFINLESLKWLNIKIWNVFCLFLVCGFLFCC